MGDKFDCSDRCRASGQCDCGAIVGDTLIGKRVVRVGLAFSDAAPTLEGELMQTTILDAPVIEAEASRSDYDWARRRMHVDGTPLDKHFARLNLLRASPAGQRVEAARDHYIDGLQHALAPAIPATVTMDTATAYAAMCKQLESAWR